MGFSPQQVRRMSIWQWVAVVDGWNKSQQGDEPDRTVTEVEAQKLFASLDERPLWEN